MSDHRKVNINDYRYELPDERIARHPLPERDRSRLLYYHRGSISHHVFTDLPGLLPAHCFLVFNDTRVIQARLWFYKSTGARIEVLCVTPFRPADYRQSLQSTGSCTWNCMVGNARKWKTGVLSQEVVLPGRSIRLEARLEIGIGEDFRVEFSWDSNEVTFGEIIASAGKTPLPPYLKREPEAGDRERYQTVYGVDPGSVAAPTAGLHFTAALVEEIIRKGITTGTLTLHVGAGTFVPVKTDDPREHLMHGERVSVSLDFLEKWLEWGGEVITVGTTTTRSLESVYWLGVLLGSGIQVDPSSVLLEQWEHESLPGDIPLRQSLASVIAYCRGNGLDQFSFTTRLMIIPGYRFRTVRGLVTNYHLPGSTLLLLIGALVGEDWRNIYREALSGGYRFLSYGDSSLLIP